MFFEYVGDAGENYTTAVYCVIIIVYQILLRRNAFPTPLFNDNYVLHTILQDFNFTY